MQFGKYPVVTTSYDHEFLKSNSFTNFSQNNAKKSKGSTIIMAWSLINNGVVMIKKPVSPNFDHSNRFPTDYIPQNFAFTYAYVGWHTRSLESGSWSHLVFIAEYHSKELYEIFC